MKGPFEKFEPGDRVTTIQRDTPLSPYNLLYGTVVGRVVNALHKPYWDYSNKYLWVVDLDEGRRGVEFVASQLKKVLT